MTDHEEHQKKLAKLWGEQEHNAVTDDEGTYVTLENFNIDDHNLTMEDTRVPGNQTLSTTKHRKDGYFLSGGNGGKFRLFKGR